ncbi:hypothetical protein CYMTET_29366 [Cymbomonas tetramitiformis]|uniref:Uncharacterized protein n=1 Tax=Cymbomonas tetramitiformis TaxID=36881 RepID=A0AAE0KUZ8_9CHLO|nr:hypothetical protein CYMTET_29366 [Cymbomonas tetramitiformis]
MRKHLTHRRTSDSLSTSTVVKRASEPGVVLGDPRRFRPLHSVQQSLTGRKTLRVPSLSKETETFLSGNSHQEAKC